MATRTADRNSPTGAPTADELPLDVVYDLLRSDRRRTILRYLQSAPGTSTLSELAEHVAAVESGDPKQAAADDDRKRVAVALAQCHLPKLADADVVEIVDDDAIRLTERGADVESHLSGVVDSAGPTSGRWLSIFLVGCGFGTAGAVAVDRWGPATGSIVLILLLPVAVALAGSGKPGD